MRCPRCVRDTVAATPYRGETRRGPIVALATERNDDAGVDVARCPSCRGVFAEYQALLAIENSMRRKKSSRGRAARPAMRRGYDPPTADIQCPSCSSETTRREWSIGTLLFVDVCVECRGVWLDGGELEALLGD